MPPGAAAPAGRRIRVLVVDDSAVIRQVLTRGLTGLGFDVVGAASNPFTAREMIVRLKPEVLTLDLEMPRMDGLTFLERLMTFHPMPVVVLSSLTAERSPLALEALALGAVEVLEKPGSEIAQGVTSRVLPRLAEILREAAEARPRSRKFQTFNGEKSNLQRTSDKLVAVGASTGGTEAISEILADLPSDHPGLVVVQHMPPHFMRAFAERLDRESAMRVREASDGDWVSDGLALIAPGNYHILLQRDGAHYRVRCRQGPPVHHMRPSVDVLFHSVAKEAGPNAVGVILTGMGRDGAEGLKAMRDSGAITLGQDEKSCVVFGMPREAQKLGAVQRIVSLDRMAWEIRSQAAYLKKNIVSGPP
jgi:two-component system chemotaxis response regulator CheB